MIPGACRVSPCTAKPSAPPWPRVTASNLPHLTHRRHIANRELGTIETIDTHGEIQVRLDDGRTVRLSHRVHYHLDYGYAVTSHSSQGQTADRVLVCVFRPILNSDSGRR
jgi:ATP-dependent exoDNAse (exonuclease V) alpha subunit